MLFKSLETGVVIRQICRAFTTEKFFYSYVAGCGQFVYLYAQIAGGCPCGLAQIDKVGLLAA